MVFFLMLADYRTGEEQEGLAKEEPEPDSNLRRAPAASVGEGDAVVPWRPVTKPGFAEARGRETGSHEFRAAPSSAGAAPLRT